jgi:hypothetical protein
MMPITNSITSLEEWIEMSVSVPSIGSANVSLSALNNTLGE